MKCKVVVIATLAIVVLLWLSTGGLVIINHPTYGGQSSIRTGDGPPLTLWVDTHVQESGIPFLFLHCGDRRPYSIRLSAYDDQKVYRKLLIDEASVEYDDGQEVRLVSPEDRWAKEFQDYFFYNSSSGGVVRNHSLKVEHSFVDAVSRPADFRLRIKSRYVREDGSVVDAGIEERYKVSRNFEVLTNWNWLARI